MGVPNIAKKKDKCKHLIEHPTYKKMYHVKFPDGTISKDFYNKTWAEEHYRNSLEGIWGIPLDQNAL